MLAKFILAEAISVNDLRKFGNSLCFERTTQNKSRFNQITPIT
jgi:hypothetical protein